MPDSAPAAQLLAGPRRAGGWLTTLGWASYLACSWTWCIGMFLPVLLVRDFGIWGFIVFAVPNVIGAAAMGWIIRSASASGDLVRRHGPALRAFSQTTIAFQTFFLTWLFFENNFRHGPPLVLLALAILMVVVAVAYRRMHRPELFPAIATWLLSAGLALAAWRLGGLRLPTTQGLLPDSHLLPLAPVCLFGFGLCPYLDLTFHRARQSLPSTAARAAFGIGFGVLFAAMILFTLLYAYSFEAGSHPTRFRDGLGLLPALVSAHMLTQTMFTCLAHGSAHTETTAAATGEKFRGPFVAVFILATFAILRTGADLTYAGLGIGEIIYRLFMSFFGLVFPAYVWLCMIPTGGETDAGPSRAKVRVWLFSVGVAAPMFWMGFIERQTWWLAPGLGVVLLARLVLPRRPPRSPGPA